MDACRVGVVMLFVVIVGCGPNNKSDTVVSAGAAHVGAGNINPQNTKIEWTGTKKGGKHDGGFRQFTGSVNPIQSPITANVITLEIDTDSLYSDTEKLTAHLKSPDFFEVKKHPNATFVSTRIEPSSSGSDTHQVTGDLTLHGTKKSITFPAKITETSDHLAIESTFTFDRTEHGITYRPEMVDKIVTVRVSAKIARK